MLQAVCNSIDRFGAQALANTAWSLAKLSVNDSPLLAVIASRGSKLVDEFNSQGLSSIAWAFATLLFVSGPLYEGIADASLRST